MEHIKNIIDREYGNLSIKEKYLKLKKRLYEKEIYIRKI